MRLGPWALWIGLLAGAGPASADVIHLDTAMSQECVILEVTEEWVTFETEMGRASLPRHKVVAISREPEETNQQHRKRWQAARAAEGARARARERRTQVERLQREALGLIAYEGEWITPEEREARITAKAVARRAAVTLSREEAAAGHQFYYGVWMTPATYQAVLGKEDRLRAYQAELVVLQQEIGLLTRKIETARMMVPREPDLERMEERSRQIAVLKGQVSTATADADAVRANGDAVTERINVLVVKARKRLERLLVARGDPVQALSYVVGPSDAAAP